MKAALPVVMFLLVFGLALPPTVSSATGHPTNACSDPYHVQSAGWDLCWQRDDPRAQGIELNQVYFQGQSVLWKIGVPFSMTKYHTSGIGPYKDTLGTPYAGNHPGYGRGATTLDPADCPRFFGGNAQLLDNGKVCVETRGGPEPAVAIWAHYDIYNYKFIQGYILDARGHMEPLVRLGGVLIDGNSGANGHNHFHHLLWRADFDIGPDGNDVAETFRVLTGSSQTTATHAQLAGLGCELDGAGGTAGWCPALVETFGVNEPANHQKWRVVDNDRRNALGHRGGFEVTMAGGAADAYSRFDVLVAQYKGDSQQIGYEVPTNPVQGDQPILGYTVPPEVIDDPVLWLVLHEYHDTRDEDRGSMSWHEARIDLRPHNLFDDNPGEATHAADPDW